MSLEQQLSNMAKKVENFARVFGIADQTRMGIEAENLAKELQALAAKTRNHVIVPVTFARLHRPGETPCWAAHVPQIHESGNAAALEGSAYARRKAIEVLQDRITKTYKVLHR